METALASTDTLTLPAMEAGLAARGISSSRLCREADVAFSTWHRWRQQEREPRRATWARVVTAYRALLREADAAAEAA